VKGYLFRFDAYGSRGVELHRLELWPGSKRFSPGNNPAGRHPVGLRHAFVAIGGDDAVEEKTRTHGGRALRDRTRQWEHERQRPNGPGRDARDRAPFPYGFTGTRKIQRLQVTKATVDRPQVVEGSSAAEVVLLDQCDRQASLSRIAGDRQPVNAAADHQDVECARGQCLWIASEG